MVDPTILIYDFLVEKITSTPWFAVNKDLEFGENALGMPRILFGQYEIAASYVNDTVFIWWGHHGEFTVSLSEPDALEKIWDFIFHD